MESIKNLMDEIYREYAGKPDYAHKEKSIAYGSDDITYIIDNYQFIVHGRNHEDGYDEDGYEDENKTNYDLEYLRRKESGLEETSHVENLDTAQILDKFQKWLEKVCNSEEEQWVINRKQKEWEECNDIKKKQDDSRIKAKAKRDSRKRKQNETD